MIKIIIFLLSIFSINIAFAADPMTKIIVTNGSDSKLYVSCTNLIHGMSTLPQEVPAKSVNHVIHEGHWKGFVAYFTGKSYSLRCNVFGTTAGKRDLFSGDFVEVVVKPTSNLSIHKGQNIYLFVNSVALHKRGSQTQKITIEHKKTLHR